MHKQSDIYVVHTYIYIHIHTDVYICICMNTYVNFDNWIVSNI